MDPIHPITPGPSAIPRGRVPLERLQRISRERDRRNKDPLAREQQRAPARRAPGGEDPSMSGEPREDGEGPHIDVRA
jgi:hypothetical protein